MSKYLVSRLLSTRPPASMPGKTLDQKQEYLLEGPYIGLRGYLYKYWIYYLYEEYAGVVQTIIYTFYILNRSI